MNNNQNQFQRQVQNPNQNQNQSGTGCTVFMILFFAFMAIFPLFAFLLLFAGIIYGCIKYGNVENGEKKTDYSGMNKNMVSKQVQHQHNYGAHQTDFCGTDKLMAKYTGADRVTTTVVNNPKRSYYDNKSTAQIYAELVNRKTDYSGVNKNLLRRG